MKNRFLSSPLATISALFIASTLGYSSFTLTMARQSLLDTVEVVLTYSGMDFPVRSIPPHRIHLSKRFVKHAEKMVQVVQQVRHEADRMAMSTYSHFQQYLYQFEGKVAKAGAIQPNTKVAVSVSIREQMVTKTTTVKEDGSYSVVVPLLATEGTPVDWHVEAINEEDQKATLAGRRIVQEDEDQQNPVVISAPVEFKPTSLE